jgi:hypothetical protein
MPPASNTKALVIGGILLIAVVGVGGYLLRPTSPELPVVHNTSTVELAPMCPWREPEADLRAFFPGATGHRQDPRILSAQRLEIQHRLGRPPTPEENALYLNQALAGEKLLGVILTRRVKGEFGGIEVVLAINPDGTARGVRLQREREPDAVSAAIRSPRWLARFRGWSPAASPDQAAILAALPAPARKTGAAIVEAVHNLLVLHEIATQRGIASPLG